MNQRQSEIDRLGYVPGSQESANHHRCFLSSNSLSSYRSTVMKNFNVYKHPVNGYEAVKVGFSWPALIFGVFWLITKKMWIRAAIWFTAYSFLFLILSENQAYDEEKKDAWRGLIFFVGFIVLWFAPAFRGNMWREKNLTSRGYENISSATSGTTDGAIAIVVKNSDALASQNPGDKNLGKAQGHSLDTKYSPENSKSNSVSEIKPPEIIDPDIKDQESSNQKVSGQDFIKSPEASVTSKQDVTKRMAMITPALNEDSWFPDDGYSASFKLPDGSVYIHTNYSDIDDPRYFLEIYDELNCCVLDEYQGTSFTDTEKMSEMLRSEGNMYEFKFVFEFSSNSIVGECEIGVEWLQFGSGEVAGYKVILSDKIEISRLSSWLDKVDEGGSIVERIS